MTSHVARGASAFPFDKHTDITSDVVVVDLSLQFTMTRFQFQKANLLLLFRNIVNQPGCGSAATLGILKDKQRVVLTLFNQLHSVLKIFIGLTGKAHDDIAR